MDLERGQQEGTVSRFLRQVAGHVVEFSAEFDGEAIGFGSYPVQRDFHPERFTSKGYSHDRRVIRSCWARPGLLRFQLPDFLTTAYAGWLLVNCIRPCFSVDIDL